MASSQPRDVASGDARLPRDAKCASATCAPLRRRQIACFSRACPYPAAALLCHLGPLLHFRKSALPVGCCQPPPAGGPLAADLSNCTRRASRQYPAPPGPTRCRGAQGISGCPGPAQRSAGPAARCAAAAAAGLQPAKRAAGGVEPTPGRCCGLGPRASPSHRSDRRLGARPRERFLPVCSLPIHRRARLVARACCATKHDNCAGVSVA